MTRRRDRRPRAAAPPAPPSPSAAEPGRPAAAGRRHAALLLAGLAVAAVAIRVIPARTVLEPAGFAAVSDPDACYHLRRAERMLAEFPSLAIRDSHLDFPAGAVVIWPPLWDLTLAGGLAVFPSDPSTRHVAAAVALLPPLLAALAVALVFALGRRLWPGGTLLPALAAAVTALLPASLPYTTLANLDHHAAELVALLACVLALGRALEQPRAPERAVLAGAALGVAVLIQAGLLVLVPALGLAALLPRAPGRAARLRCLAVVLGTAAVAVAPWSLAYTLAGAALRHYQFGLFQPLVLAAAALGALAAAELWPERGTPPSRLRWGLAIPAAVLALTLAAVAARESAGGAGFLAGESAWVSSIGESRSLLRMPPRAALAEVYAAFSLLPLALPFGAVALLKRARRSDAMGAMGAVGAMAAAAAAALLLTTVLALLQARFFPHLAMTLGIAVAAVVAGGQGRPPLRRAVLLAAAVVVALALPYLRPRPPEQTAITFARVEPVLHALRERTPHPAPSPGGPPAYGVLAEWSLGHLIQYYGDRPALADNFGEHAGDPTLPRRVLLASEEAAALALLDERRGRYLLVGDLAGTFAGLLPTDGDSARLVRGAALRPGGIAAIEFAPAIAGTVLYRLARHFGGGVADPQLGWVPPLRHFRLLATSPAREELEAAGEAARAVPWFKLYERVAGARLVIAGLPPGGDALLSAEVLAPDGSTFPYLDLLRADAAGIAEIRYPHPSDAVTGSRTVRARLMLDDAALELPPIPESAVEAGSVVAIPVGLIREKATDH